MNTYVRCIFEPNKLINTQIKDMTFAAVKSQSLRYSTLVFKIA